jgi:hypothetical protein
MLRRKTIMPNLLFCRIAIVAVLTTAILGLFPPAAQAVTQRDWMVALVDSLGRSFGLPDEPKSEDYINILTGKRNLRFEAEATYAEGDEVTIMSFLNFGPFSGPGWLLGPGKPTSVHLRFILPLDGRYQLVISARRPGFAVKAGGQTFNADGGDQKFARVELGELPLTAGPQEVVVTLPPGGALDYLELIAPNLPPIVPDGGWQADAALTWDVLALTAVEALHLEKNLPVAEWALAIEAETLAETGGAQVVEDAHLGQPSGGRWLRTAAQSATVVVPLTIEQSGFYDIQPTLMGAKIDILVNGHQPLTIDGKPYLDTAAPSPLFLTKGSNRLDISLPPGGGFDRIMIKARQSDRATLAAVLGLVISGEAPTSADIDRLTARLSSATR